MHRLHGRVGREGMASREELVGHRPQREEIARRPGRLSEDLLRITSAWDAKAAAVDSVPVSLERTDIQVAQLVLAWLPVA